MREKYSLEKICNYLKIDTNKMVNFDELWNILCKIKGQFDVVFRNENNGYCIMNIQEIGMKLDDSNTDKHPLFMWIEYWEMMNDYELIGFELNNVTYNNYRKSI